MKKQNENNWQYYGLFLDKDTRDELISFIDNSKMECAAGRRKDSKSRIFQRVQSLVGIQNNVKNKKLLYYGNSF